VRSPRMVDLAVEAAGDSDVDNRVHHLLAPERGRHKSKPRWWPRLGDKVQLTYTSEIGAVVARRTSVRGLVSIVMHRR